jgi:hypothetical protein
MWEANCEQTAHRTFTWCLARGWLVWYVVCYCAVDIFRTYSHTNEEYFMSILFMDSVMGMWQQLSKNIINDSQMANTQLACIFFHPCAGGCEKSVNIPNHCLSIQYSKQVIRKKSYSRWYSQNISANQCAINEGMENSYLSWVISVSLGTVEAIQSEDFSSHIGIFIWIIKSV